ncbi:MAG: hypothetical protein K0S34_633 [Bacillales bacterium]|jgi:hypothetical protein|nr:hypothetical protein [Bacillales bacterium]
MFIKGGITVTEKYKLNIKDTVFFLYFTLMIFTGWLMDVNGVLLSKYFRLSGLITMLLVGTMIWNTIIKRLLKK